MTYLLQYIDYRKQAKDISTHVQLNMHRIFRTDVRPEFDVQQGPKRGLNTFILEFPHLISLQYVGFMNVRHSNQLPFRELVLLLRKEQELILNLTPEPRSLVEICLPDYKITFENVKNQYVLPKRVLYY